MTFFLWVTATKLRKLKDTVEKRTANTETESTTARAFTTATEVGRIMDNLRRHATEAYYLLSVSSDPLPGMIMTSEPRRVVHVEIASVFLCHLNVFAPSHV